MKRHLVLLVAAALLLAGCGGPSRSGVQASDALPAPSAHFAPPAAYQAATSASVYREDLLYLQELLAQNHPGYDGFGFSGRVQELSARLDGMDDMTFHYEVSRLLASMGDAHTTAGLPQGTRLFPVWQVAPFQDGWRILGIDRAYAACLGGRLTAIGGVPVEEILTRAAPFIPHENRDQVGYIFMEALIGNCELLRVLGVVDDLSAIPITVERTDGTVATVSIRTVPADDFSVYGQVAWLNAPATVQAGKWSPQNYDFRELDGLLYIEYNYCNEDEARTVALFQQQLLAQLQGARYTKVVFDLRYNEGGMASLFAPVVSALADQMRQQGFELYVLIGPKTFSTAVIHAVQLKNAGAILVGGATRGAPNFHADTIEFTLPRSGIQGSCSTQFNQMMPGYSGNTLQPDIMVPQDFTRYAQGIDVDLEAVKNHSATA